MDKKLQKEILKVIKLFGGEAPAPLLRQTVIKQYWEADESTDEQQKAYLHQLKLLTYDGKIEKEDRNSNIYYVITSPGYLSLSSFYKRAWNFLLYDKHNLFLILAFLVSLISLCISLYSFKGDRTLLNHGEKLDLQNFNKGIENTAL